MRNGSLLFISGLTLALGCSSSGPEPLLEDPGKADSLASVCSFGTSFIAGETSSEMEASVVSAVEMSAGDIDSLNDAQTAQILAAAAHLAFIEVEGDVGGVFDAVDEGTIEFLQLDIEEDGESRGYDWLRFFAGDTEVGVVFADNSAKLVAEISDGDVLGCTTPKSAEELQAELDAAIAGLFEDRGVAGMTADIDLLESQIQADLDSGVSLATAVGSAVDAVLADGAVLLAFTEGEIPSVESCPELPFSEALACALGSLGTLRLVPLGETVDGPANPEDDWVFELSVGGNSYYAAVNRADSAATARVFSGDSQ